MGKEFVTISFDDKYYNDYFELFMQPGWTQLMDELKERYDMLNDIRYISTPEEFMLKKGRVEVLSDLLGFKELIEASYKAALEV